MNGLLLQDTRSGGRQPEDDFTAETTEGTEAFSVFSVPSVVSFFVRAR